MNKISETLKISPLLISNSFLLYDKLLIKFISCKGGASKSRSRVAFSYRSAFNQHRNAMDLFKDVLVRHISLYIGDRNEIIW